MHWQIISLIILPLLSAQMLLHLYSVKLKKNNINFSSENVSYNMPFSLDELQDASEGPNEIHYQLLKHLPDASLLLLNIFNQIWISGNFPSDWRKAIVIPIPKPGKDPTKDASLRP